ncbi:MAG: hypothetical protein ABIK65_12380 [Candidatus Eisenbacteria bacterium]
MASRNRRFPLLVLSLLLVACGGGGGGKEEGPLTERIVRGAADRIYLHGEEILGDTLLFAWVPGGEATLCGRPLRPPPLRLEESEEDLGTRYGRVPSVKRLTEEGKSLADGVAGFRRAEEDLRRRLSASYRSALPGGSEEEATLAAIRSLTDEDRSLLAGDPVPGPGVVEIRFAGRPPETWILRSPGKRGIGAPGSMSRKGVARLAGELRGALSSSPEGTLTVLGRTVHILGDPEEIGRGAAQIEGAREGRAEEGPLPPEALLPFRSRR